MYEAKQEAKQIRAKGVQPLDGSPYRDITIMIIISRFYFAVPVF